MITIAHTPPTPQSPQPECQRILTRRGSTSCGNSWFNRTPNFSGRSYDTKKHIHSSSPTTYANTITWLHIPYFPVFFTSRNMAKTAHGLSAATVTCTLKNLYCNSPANDSIGFPSRFERFDRNIDFHRHFMPCQTFMHNLHIFIAI